MMRWPVQKSFPRSLLFVPGNAPEKLRKAWKYGPDALIFDLEDAVPEAQKSEARRNVREVLTETAAPAGLIFVRINDYHTPHWEEDIHAVVSPNLHGLFLPKCDAAEFVEAVAGAVESGEKKAGRPLGSVGLFLMVESPEGLLQIPRVTEASRRVQALAFGAEDFCLEMGISRTKEGNELLYARSHLAVTARATGCLAVDAVYTDFQDAPGLLRECQVSKQLGYGGKLAIHPKQLETIHTAFSPSEEELGEARKIVEAFESAQASRTGVAALDGKMIDQPIVERARRLLAFSRRHPPML